MNRLEEVKATIGIMKSIWDPIANAAQIPSLSASAQSDIRQVQALITSIANKDPASMIGDHDFRQVLFALHTVCSAAKVARILIEEQKALVMQGG
jgi:hypothetical protein